MTEKLSLDEARKLVLLSQRLPWTKPQGRAIEATLEAISHLGYIQIDTISVVERAHHHTLWNRNRRYQSKHLDQLLQNKQVYEYWSHAAAYLPMADYRFSLPRMQAFADGQRHWFEPDHKLMKEVLDRIRIEGPLQTRDFEFKRKGKIQMWDWKPAKQALEQLFMEGKLMTLRRQGFNKVYDLAERVLPDDVDTAMPTEEEYGRFLVSRYLRTNGLGQAAEVAYLRTGIKPVIERSMTEMAGRGEIVALMVKDKTYYALPESLDLLKQPLSRKRLRILSPFDNLVIQRKRMQQLFNFDYQIECYTPAKKRKHGYFCLPVLWNGRLVARLDCKAERKTKTLLIRNLVAEQSLRNQAPFIESLADELAHFARFNQCDSFRIEKLHDKALQGMLIEALGHQHPDRVPLSPKLI